MSEVKQAIELDSPMLGWLDKFREIQGHISELEDEAAAVRNKIEVAMGEAEIATHNGVRVLSWTHQPGAFRFDIASAKAKLGEAGYKALCVQGAPTRRFVIDKDGK